MSGFVQFIREQGVIGLAIGFILGGAVGKIVASLVADVINPLLGLVLGGTNLATMAWGVVNVGAFVSAIIDFLIIAAVVYFGFKGLRLDRLDAKKEG